MDTYVKSCAGYCVVTFLLSIGDRHLENVMLRVSDCNLLQMVICTLPHTHHRPCCQVLRASVCSVSCSIDSSVLIREQADGHLLHVDFGYSFGNDPKPFPPPMKLTKEMVEGMGGVKSAEYKAFLSLCLQVH